MRVQVSVKNKVPVRASLENAGWLSVHLNLSSDDPGNSGRLWVQAIDKSDEPNSIFSTWELGTLCIGDTTQIEVLGDGVADHPTAVRRTLESPDNLFSDIGQARKLLSAIGACDKELMTVLEESRTVEPEDEFKKITRAIGGIVSDLDRYLIQPILRRHPELLSEAQEKRLV